MKVAQVEVDATRAGSRLPTDVPLIGDVSATLEALLPLLRRRAERGHLEKYQKQMGEWREKMAALESAQRDPIAPQYLAHVLDEMAAEDAVLTCDSGTIATWAARHWQIRGSREFYLSGNLASMAPGLPYAIGIQHAHPGRQVIAYIGDGGFAMLMAEFHTAVWHGLPVKVVINNNSSLGQILWEQMVLGYQQMRDSWRPRCRCRADAARRGGHRSRGPRGGVARRGQGRGPVNTVTGRRAVNCCPSCTARTWSRRSPSSRRSSTRPDG